MRDDTEASTREQVNIQILEGLQAKQRRMEEQHEDGVVKFREVNRHNYRLCSRNKGMITVTFAFLLKVKKQLVMVSLERYSLYSGIVLFSVSARNPLHEK